MQITYWTSLTWRSWRQSVILWRRYLWDGTASSVFLPFLITWSYKYSQWQSLFALDYLIEYWVISYILSMPWPLGIWEPHWVSTNPESSWRWTPFEGELIQWMLLNSKGLNLMLCLMVMDSELDLVVECFLSNCYFSVKVIPSVIPQA